MAAKTLKMEKIRLIINKKLLGQSIRGISKDLEISRNTVKSYLKSISETKLDLMSVSKLDDESLYKIFKEKKYVEKTPKDESFVGDLKSYQTKLNANQYLSKQILWEDYIKQNPQGYSYSQFCKILRDSDSSIQVINATFHNELID